MTEEAQEGSTGEKSTDSEEESMRGDDRRVEAQRSRKEAGKEAKEREKKERASKNKKKNSRWSNLQTEAKDIKEEDDTQMSGVTEKTEEEGEQTDFETTDEDEIVDENTKKKLRWRNLQTEAKPLREENDTQMSGVAEKKEGEGEQTEVADEEEKTSERKSRKVIADEDRMMGFGPYRMNTYGEVLRHNPRYAMYLIEEGK